MNKKLVKHAISWLILTIVLIMPIIAMPVLTHAVAANLDEFGSEDVVKQININQGDDLLGVVADVINVVLGLLGLIAVIIILIAGFEWMTAGGNTDTVKKAQTRMKNGLIGLAVIFLSWVIVSFVLNTLVDKIR